MVNDWNHGKIPFYVTPPEVKEEEGSAQVKSVMDARFDIEGLVQRNHAEAMEVVRKQKDRRYVEVEEDRFVVGDDDEDGSDVDDDEEEDVEMGVDAESRVADDEISNTHAFMNA